MTQWVPELLSPAGDLEKLKVSVLYGADAVYLGGQNYNLRSASTNFSLLELKEAASFVHDHGAKLFIVVNNFFHDEDFSEFGDFLGYLEKIKVDALIASDLGVINFSRKNFSHEIHLSTQASCLNAESAKFWKSQGVSRVVLGREITISEAKKIKEEAQVEVEMFVHGSMCMAYSGHCTISNFTSGRDSNRGGCAHSCRFEYSMESKSSKKNAFFMSSKDLNGLMLLPKFIEAKIDSLKIEGRMKSNNYAGGVTKSYAEALRFYKRHGNFSGAPLELWAQELEKVTHREYTEASLLGPAGTDSIYFEREHEYNDYQLLGRVLATKKDDYILVETRSKFNTDDEIEIVPFQGPARSLRAHTITSVRGDKLDSTKPSSLVKIPYIQDVSIHNIVRKRIHV